mmetsp:Transcript_52550/g.132088  ORF Transcript_52550/g.132088 Transcript_52550/m.132088 type:complete len:128 (-) Transcript_52550:600-983(-)
MHICVMHVSLPAYALLLRSVRVTQVLKIPLSVCHMHASLSLHLSGSQAGGFPHHTHLQWEAPRVRIHSSTHTHTYTERVPPPAVLATKKSPASVITLEKHQDQHLHPQVCILPSLSLCVCVALCARH